MTAPLPCGPSQLDYTLWPIGPGDDSTVPTWKSTVRSPSPSNALSLIQRARDNGVLLYANLPGARATWTNTVNGILIFDENKFKGQVDRWTTAGGHGAPGCSAAVAAAITAAITDRVFIVFVIDEWYSARFGGSITSAKMNEMCLYVKSKWPDALTVIRTGSSRNLNLVTGGQPDPLEGVPPGGYTGVDYACAWYTSSTARATGSLETPAQFFSRNKTEMDALDIGMSPGFNWVNSPDDRCWDHDQNAGTADRRVWGDNTADQGRVVDCATATTNRLWLCPPQGIRDMADAVAANSGYLSMPAFQFYIYPDDSAYDGRAVYTPYWLRSDYVSALDYLLNKFNTRASFTGFRTPKGIAAPPPPPSESIEYLYDDLLNIITTTSETYVDTGLNVSGFIAGHKYLLMCTADVSISGNTNGVQYMRLVHNATEFVGSVEQIQPHSINHKHPYTFFTVWTAASETVKLQVHVHPASGKTLSITHMTLFALDLDSLPASVYQNNVNNVSTALSGVYADGASTTFTPPVNNHRWLIMTRAQIATPSVTFAAKSRISTSVGGVLDPEKIRTGKDAINDIMQLTNMKIATLPNSAHIIKEQSANTGGGGPRTSSEIFCLDIDAAFAAAGAVYTSGLQVLNTVIWGDQIQTIAFDPTAAGFAWVLGGMGWVGAGNARRARARMQVDNADAPDNQTSDAYERQTVGSTDAWPITHQSVLSLTDASHTIDLDASDDIFNGSRGMNARMLMAVQLASAAGGGGGNTAPVWDAIFPFTINEGQQLTFNVHATDADLDTLTYSATHLPEGAQFDPATQQFTWQPSRTQAGFYTVLFSVNDGTVAVPLAVDINVVDVPDPLDFKELRNLRYDAAVQGGRIDIVVKWNGVGNSNKQQGITGIEVVMADLERS